MLLFEKLVSAIDFCTHRREWPRYEKIMLLETIGLMGSVPALAASDTLPILSFEEGAAPRAIGAWGRTSSRVTSRHLGSTADRAS